MSGEAPPPGNHGSRFNSYGTGSGYSFYSNSTTDHESAQKSESDSCNNNALVTKTKQISSALSNSFQELPSSLPSSPLKFIAKQESNEDNNTITDRKTNQFLIIDKPFQGQPPAALLKSGTKPQEISHQSSIPIPIPRPMGLGNHRQQIIPCSDEGPSKRSLNSSLDMGSFLVMKKSRSNEELSEMENYFCTTPLAGNQGLTESPDKSWTLLHDSTVPENEYPDEEFRNMDRGGVGQNKNGLNYAVIFDGAGSTKTALDAAQAFTKSALKTLAKETFSTRSIKEISCNIFAECAKSCEAGNATGGFVYFEPKDTGFCIARGAAVGDVAIFHISTKKGEVFQLNKINRKHVSDKSDPGGLICGGYPDHSDIKSPYTFSNEISYKDAILLATDGLLDNIDSKDSLKILAYIIFSSKFDEPIENLRLIWGNKIQGIPSKKKLKEFIGSQNSNNPVDNKCIIKRLNTYLRLVTRYDNEMQYQANTFCYEVEKNSKIARDEKKEIIKKYKDNHYNKSHRNSKTDDCLLIILSPASNLF